MTMKRVCLLYLMLLMIRAHVSMGVCEFGSLYDHTIQDPLLEGRGKRVVKMHGKRSKLYPK